MHSIHFNRILVYFFIYSLCWSITVKAQDSTFKVNIASPTAASLGKYGDIPVSYHTGIPQISIPVYTATAGPLSLPISLSYHASGLKVAEAASWVGAGWSLNAGGVITRSVIGAPDDKGYGDYMATHYVNYGYSSYLASGSPAAPDDLSFGRGNKDGQPDLYFFNFGSYTGKFYFNDDRKPVLVPEADFKIFTDYDAANGGFQGFIITDDDGVQYYFGKTGNTGSVHPIEWSVPATLETPPANSPRAASAWYLNKIVSADGKFTISLSYTAENYSSWELSMFPLLSNDFVGKNEYNVVKNFIQGFRLNQISFPNGTVTFVPSSTARTDLSGYSNQNMFEQTNTEAKSLSEIQIADGAGFCKKFTFAYNYFFDNSSLPVEINNLMSDIVSDKYRLRLDSVKESSCDNSLKLPAYRFNYFTEQVPRRLSFGLDHWGYYNGVTINQTLIPSYTVINGSTITPVAGANRETAWPAMRGGALKKINYPTGGSTELEFEPHTTYTSYTQSSWVQAMAPSLGFDGNAGPYDVIFTANANPYKVDITNTSIHESVLEIYTYPGGTFVQVMGAYGQSTNQYNITLPSAGQYRLNMRLLSGGNPNPTGTGVEARFTQWTSQTMAQNQTVGGLRIKNITNNDALTSTTNTTSYSYLGAGTQSSGILYSRPVYVLPVRSDIYGLIVGAVSCGSLYGCPVCAGTNPYFKSPGSVTPMSTTQGNHIGYNEVKVSKSGNGYSVYQYYGSPVWDVVSSDIATRQVDVAMCNNTTASYPFVPQPFEFMRGELKYEKHYNESGLLLKQSFHTPTYIPNPDKTPAYIVGLLSSSGGTPPWITSNFIFMAGVEYELQTAKKAKTVEVATTFDLVNTSLSNSTTTTTYFGSAFHNQPTRIVTSTSATDSLITNLKYAADYRVAACDALSNGLSTYTSAVATATSNLYGNINTCSPQTAGADNCRLQLYKDYRIAKANARIAYINTRKTNFTNPSNQFDINHLSAKNGAGTELKPILELHDNFQNPVIEQNQWRNNKLLGASFTRFDYVTNPVNEVYPNKTQAISVLTPGTTFTNSAVSGTTITKDSRYKDETFVKFDNGQIVEVTPKSGAVQSYIWGHNNSFPVVKASGITFAALKTAYDAAGQSLTGIRTQLSANNAILNTYVYSPLKGITSETGPDENPLTYEYDALGRLLRIRDFNSHILKQWDYQYQQSAGTIFTNDAQSGTFTRNNCGTNYTGSQVAYTVNAGTYTSTVSKPAANQLAIDDVNANGQAYANANGGCTYTGPYAAVQGHNSLSTSLQVKFTNTANSDVITFNVNSSTFSPYSLGQVPHGTYNIQFIPGMPVNATYKVNTLTQSGQFGATFYNFSVNATTTVSRF